MIIAEIKYDQASWRIKSSSAGKRAGKKYTLHKYFRVGPKCKPGEETYRCNAMKAAIAYYWARKNRGDILERLFRRIVEDGSAMDIAPFIPVKEEKAFYATVDLLKASNVRPIFVNVGIMQ